MNINSLQKVVSHQILSIGDFNYNSLLINITLLFTCVHAEKM